MENTTKTDWSKIIINDGWDRRPLNLYDNNTTYTKVICKDGTTKNQPSSPNARYIDSCINNGGVDNQKTNDNAIAQPEATTGGINPNGMYNTQGSNAKEPIFYILVTAGVLVAGYFAYKKFKK